MTLLPKFTKCSKIIQWPFAPNTFLKRPQISVKLLERRPLTGVTIFIFNQSGRKMTLIKKKNFFLFYKKMSYGLCKESAPP